MDMTLVILAAGRSRRFGKMKQIEAVGPNEEVLIEYTLFDAVRAGFKKAILVTNEEVLPVLKSKFDCRKYRQVEINPGGPVMLFYLHVKKYSNRLAW